MAAEENPWLVAGVSAATGTAASLAAADKRNTPTSDLPSYALRQVPQSRGGGGIFFLKSERRDWTNVGRGGGFYERQDTRDKKEWDSGDEDIDEFGRKKRRRISSATTAARRGSDAKEEDRAQEEASSRLQASPSTDLHAEVQSTHPAEVSSTSSADRAQEWQQQLGASPSTMPSALPSGLPSAPIGWQSQASLNHIVASSFPALQHCNLGAPTLGHTPNTLLGYEAWMANNCFVGQLATGCPRAPTPPLRPIGKGIPRHDVRMPVVAGSGNASYVETRQRNG